MSVARVSRTVTMGTTDTDVLQGQPLRFIRRTGPVQIGITIASTALIGDGIAEVLIGGRSVSTGYVIPLESAAGRGPLANQDIMVLAKAAAGEEVIVNLQNTDGATNHRMDVYVNVPNQ